MTHARTRFAPIAAAVALALGAGALCYADPAAAQSRMADARAGAPAAKAPEQAPRQQFIIRYHDQSLDRLLPAASSDLLQTSGRVVGVQAEHRRFMATGAQVIAVDRALDRAERKQFMEALASDPRVRDVTLDALMQPHQAPNDPLYPDQAWHYADGPGGINAVEAWEFSTGEGVVVAVVDTGYRPHVDLEGTLISNGYDFISSAFISRKPEGRNPDAIDLGDYRAAGDCTALGGPPSSATSSWHGTHVAGTIAALTNNDVGVASVAYDAKILPVRALGRCGGFTSDVVDAIVWAAGGPIEGVPDNEHPARIVNLSLGSGQPCPSITQDGIDIAVGLGATVVASAGNSGTNAANASPASCEGVIAVAANGITGARANYSNHGPVVDVMAPGGSGAISLQQQVLSTVNTGTTVPAGDGYEFYFGTSMAAPHVAGTAALMYAIDPDLTPAEVKQILVDTSFTGTLPTNCDGNDLWCGPGIIDARFAAAVVAGAEDAPPTAPGPGDIEPELPDQVFNGEPVTGLSAETDEMFFFYVDIPAGATDLVITTAGDNGDADLYVRFGQAPTRTAFDCRSWTITSNEICTFANPQAGQHFIMIDAYEGYTDLTLTATWNKDPVEYAVLENGEPVEVSGPVGSFTIFQLEIDEGDSNLLVEIYPGDNPQGDADLFVRYGTPPELVAGGFDCYAGDVGNTEECAFEDPQVGTWYVGVWAYPEDGDLSGVFVEANWLEAGGATGPSDLEVTTSGARMRPLHTLSWTGGGDEIDVYRNGVLVYSGENTGSYSRTVNIAQGASTYQVCDAGTDECTSEVDA